MEQQLHPEAIGTALKKARKRLGLTMQDAAASVGLSQSQLSRIEVHGTQITAERLLKLARLYQVPPEELFVGSVEATMAESELAKIGLVIEFVENTLSGNSTRPSAKKIRDTVLSIYRLESKFSIQNNVPFDPGKYAELVSTLNEPE